VQSIWYIFMRQRSTRRRSPAHIDHRTRPADPASFDDHPSDRTGRSIALHRRWKEGACGAVPSRWRHTFIGQPEQNIAPMTSHIGLVNVGSAEREMTERPAAVACLTGSIAGNDEGIDRSALFGGPSHQYSSWTAYAGQSSTERWFVIKLAPDVFHRLNDSHRGLTVGRIRFSDA